MEDGIPEILKHMDINYSGPLIESVKVFRQDGNERRELKGVELNYIRDDDRIEIKLPKEIADWARDNPQIVDAYVNKSFRDSN